jgi:hypothetical protein
MNITFPHYDLRSIKPVWIFATVHEYAILTWNMVSVLCYKAYNSEIPDSRNALKRSMELS